MAGKKIFKILKKLKIKKNSLIPVLKNLLRKLESRGTGKRRETEYRK